MISTVPSREAPQGETAREPRLVRFAAVLVASFLLGGLTFPAQGFLPEALGSLANSSSGWTLLTALLVVSSRARPAPAAALGAASFVLLVLGYTAAASLAGLTYGPLLFSCIGLVVGPFVGCAAAWLRSEHSWRTAAGASLLAGIALGDAVYGLTVVAATTSPVYWIAIGLCGLALLVGVLARRARTAAGIAIAVIGTPIVAAALLGGYLATNSLL